MNYCKNTENYCKMVKIQEKIENTEEFKQFKRKLYKTLNLVFDNWKVFEGNTNSDFKDIFWQFSFERMEGIEKASKSFNDFCIVEFLRLEAGTPTISRFIRDDSKVLIDVSELKKLMETVDNVGFKQKLTEKYFKNE